jgi:hypothetical protein
MDLPVPGIDDLKNLNVQNCFCLCWQAEDFLKKELKSNPLAGGSEPFKFRLYADCLNTRIIGLVLCVVLGW